MTIPRSIIQSAVTEVLETMYFMSPNYCGEELRDRDLIEVVVGFSGHSSGSFRMTVTRRLAIGMATEFLACEPECVRLDQVEATVEELANVACGAAMSAWMPAAKFDYDLPRSVHAPPDMGGHTFSVVAGVPEIAFCVELAVQQ